MSMIRESRAWVEIDLGAVRRNYEAVRQRIGPAPALVPMVKADGYGLGVERIVRALEPLAPWGYGVATAEEGDALRRAGVTRAIVVFSPLPSDAVALAASAGLTASVSDLQGLAAWAAAAQRVGRPLDFHVEVDTGMGRSGFDWRDVRQWCGSVHAAARNGAVRWQGIFTHFQGADAAERAPTEVQWARFEDTLRQLPVSREALFVHAANSAAALRWPEYAADAVRPGIFLYGGHPAPRLAPGELPAPEHAVSVRARLLLVRDVAPGTTVGYGAVHTAQATERWGTLGIGYGDGLPRALGNRGFALVHGRRVPIVGRVSMDLTVVDLTSVPDAKMGDFVTLIGEDAGSTITVDEVAEAAGTIGYEILTGLTPRLPRVEVA